MSGEGLRRPAPAGLVVLARVGARGPDRGGAGRRTDLGLTDSAEVCQKRSTRCPRTCRKTFNSYTDKLFTTLTN